MQDTLYAKRYGCICSSRVWRQKLMHIVVNTNDKGRLPCGTSFLVLSDSCFGVGFGTVFAFYVSR